MRDLRTQTNIPRGWQEKKLGDVCDIVNGSTPKRSVSEYWENGNIPWFTVDDIRSNGRIICKTNQSITDKALRETSVKLLPEDSVLLCCTASLGEVALTKISLTTNQQFNGLVSKDKANLFPYYLFYSAQKLGEGLKSKSGKTTINFLSVGSLSKEKVLIPPIKEQQKIAEILGTVDEDIAKTQEVIEATEKLKRGLMQQLFTRGIGHTKFKETKIGSIPDGWNLVQIKDAPIKIADGNYSAKYPRQDEFIDDGIPFVRVNNLQDQTLTKEDLKYISAEKHADLKKGHLKISDVLITTRGKLGVIALVPSEFEDANINAQIVLLRADNKELLPKFLMYFLLSPEFQSQVFSGGSGSALQQLPVRVLENTYIPLPSLKEQLEIAEIFSSVDEKIMINKKLKTRLTLLKKGLMQDLLSGTARTNI